MLMVLVSSTIVYSQTKNVDMEKMNLNQQWDKTFSLSSNVKHQKVTFPTTNGTTLVGDLYMPNDAKGMLSAIVVTYPAGAVKEMSSGLYAMKLATKGFAALAFDASHQGESEGTPRYMELPCERIEDIHCAIDYLSNLEIVDKNKIGAMGICAGAGYTINASLTDRRIKAVAGVSGTDAGAAIRDGWMEDTPIEQQIALLEEASEQRTKKAAGAKQLLGTYVPEQVTDDMPVTMKEAHDYYRTSRAKHPRSENKVSLTSMLHIMNFEAYHLMEKLLTQPLLMVVGSKSDAFYLSERAISKAASHNKELFIIDGATHVDMYDQQPFVDQAIIKLAVFFKENL